MKENWKELADQVRRVHPLVHHITNYVTANDSANMVLSLGASPVMADDPAEAAAMTGAANALVLNLGTLDSRRVDSMLRAGAAANARGIPVILDPVGCGATPFRTQMARTLVERISISVLRGNSSEIRCLCGLPGQTNGVDASEDDQHRDFLCTAREAARRLHCVTAVTGRKDCLSDGERSLWISNGCSAMARLTGTGCMCTSMIGAFCGASPDRLFDAAAAAVACMGLCGEIAWAQTETLGLGHFHMALFDAAGKMNGTILEKGARIDEAKNRLYTVPGDRPAHDGPF